METLSKFSIFLVLLSLFLGLGHSTPIINEESALIGKTSKKFEPLQAKSEIEDGSAEDSDPIPESMTSWSEAPFDQKETPGPPEVPKDETPEAEVDSVSSAAETEPDVPNKETSIDSIDDLPPPPTLLFGSPEKILGEKMPGESVSVPEPAVVKAGEEADQTAIEDINTVGEPLEVPEKDVQEVQDVEPKIVPHPEIVQSYHPPPFERPHLTQTAFKEHYIAQILKARRPPCPMPRMEVPVSVPSGRKIQEDKIVPEAPKKSTDPKGSKGSKDPIIVLKDAQVSKSKPPIPVEALNAVIAEIEKQRRAGKIHFGKVEHGYPSLHLIPRRGLMPPPPPPLKPPALPQLPPPTSTLPPLPLTPTLPPPPANVSTPVPLPPLPLPQLQPLKSPPANSNAFKIPLVHKVPENIQKPSSSGRWLWNLFGLGRATETDKDTHANPTGSQPSPTIPVGGDYYQEQVILKPSRNPQDGRYYDCPFSKIGKLGAGSGSEEKRRAKKSFFGLFK